MPFFGLLTAGVSAGGSLLGGLFGKNSANQAAQVQAQNAQKVAQMAETAAQGGEQAAQTGQQTVAAASPAAISAVNSGTTAANQTLAGVLPQEQANVNPILQAGTQGVTSLASALQPGGALSTQFSFNPSNLQSDPGYQFQLQQGENALQSSAAAHGSLQSGNTLASLLNYSQGLASTEYQNAYNRSLTTYQTNYGNTLNSTQALAGYALPASAQANSALQNYGNLSSANTLNAGYYTGQNLTGTANTLANLGITGANFGIQGAQIAGQALTGGANAQAAGIVGGSNALWGGVAGAANSLQGYNALNQLQYNSLPYSLPGGSTPGYGEGTGFNLGSSLNPVAPPPVGGL